MALSDDEVERLTELLVSLAPVKHKLNSRERQFVTDVEERHDQYGSEMFMSPRQWNWLISIGERYT
jgi:hypothetical protein